MARMSKLVVKYNGNDISKNISKSLINFTYIDDEQGKADSIDILLENKNGYWTTDNYPEPGATIEVDLNLFDWVNLGDKLKVHWGRFKIDELVASSDGTFSIKAISENAAGSFTKEKQFKTWENISLREVLEEIAKNNNMKLIWKPGVGTVFERIYQIEQTDSDFIVEKCGLSAGFKIKVTNDKIIIYEDTIGESGLNLYARDISSFEFSSKTFNCYSAAELKYFNSETGELVTFREEDPEIKNKKVLILNQDVKNSEEAKTIVKSRLKNANSKAITASISMIGNPSVFSGYTVNLKKFGVFSGTYIIDKVTHKIDNQSGYRVNFEASLKR